MPPARTWISAAVAAGLPASDVVLLTLFLNPEVSARRDAPALFVSLFLPYVLAGTRALGLVAVIASLLPGHPLALRAPLERLPWFTTLALVAAGGAAGLFWLN